MRRIGWRWWSRGGEVCGMGNVMSSVAAWVTFFPLKPATYEMAAAEGGGGLLRMTAVLPETDVDVAQDAIDPCDGAVPRGLLPVAADPLLQGNGCAAAISVSSGLTPISSAATPAGVRPHLGSASSLPCRIFVGSV